MTAPPTRRPPLGVRALFHALLPIAERDEARAGAATDGPTYNAGRSEGRADVAAYLRAILDPGDVHNWNLDGALAEVRRLMGENTDALARAERAEKYASDLAAWHPHSAVGPMRLIKAEADAAAMREALDGLRNTLPQTNFTEAELDREDLRPCSSCGAPTVGDLCAFCKLVERATR